MAIVAPPQKMTVLIKDTERRSIVPESDSIRLLSFPDIGAIESALHVFVLATDAQLEEVADFVLAAFQQHRLRAFLVRLTQNPTWLLQRLRDSRLRKVGIPVRPYEDPIVARRIIEAWECGAQNELIADAFVDGDNLLVQSCDLTVLPIPYTIGWPLNCLSREERSEFTIDEDGSSIYWPKADIKMDLQGLRALCDPSLEERLNREKIVHDERFGRAVQELRVQANLRQTDIPGLSDRHVRRIEAGEGISAEAIRHLAQAHGMPANDYMHAIADLMAQIKSEERRHRARSPKL